MDCGTALIDEEACVRPTCGSDADCPEDTRCTGATLSRHYECGENNGTCNCTDGLGLFPLKVCSPIEAVGPRGTWQDITITVGGFGGVTERTILPDGTVAITQSMSFDSADNGTSAAQLSAADLVQLSEMIDGMNVRAALANPVPCPQVLDDSTHVILNLDGVVLEKEFGGCRLSSHRADPIEPLVALAEKY